MSSDANFEANVEALISGHAAPKLATAPATKAPLPSGPKPPKPPAPRATNAAKASTSTTSSPSRAKTTPTTTSSSKPQSNPPSSQAPQSQSADSGSLDTIMDQKRENARRQKLVSNTLRAKLGKVQQEAKKLSFIQSELVKLDKQLLRNIDILRKEIEGVGREVVDAQREFDRTEKAYMEARTRLSKAKDRKVLLTSHLDFIILTNERQKAQKLKELQEQLDIATADQEAEEEGDTVRLLSEHRTPDPSAVPEKAKDSSNQPASKPKSDAGNGNGGFQGF